MQRHGHRDDKHESAIERERTSVEGKHAHGFNVIDPKRAEEEQRPSAADAGAAEQAIAFVLFQINATHKEKRGGEVRDTDFAERAKSAELVDAEKSDAYHENDDAEFVEPVCAEGFFDRRDGFHALLGSRPRSKQAIRRDGRWRGDARRRGGRNLRR